MPISNWFATIIERCVISGGIPCTIGFDTYEPVTIRGLVLPAIAAPLMPQVHHPTTSPFGLVSNTF
jgi:hypothetical protein